MTNSTRNKSPLHQPKDTLPEAAREMPDNLKRDISTVLSIETLKTLNTRQLDIISLKLLGISNIKVAQRMGISERNLRRELQKDELRVAMAEATWNLKSGLLTASDVAQAAESDVLLGMYAMFKDSNVPLEWRYKFGSKVLDHRLNVAKAIGSMMPREAMPTGSQVQVIEIENSMKKRMAQRLGEVENIPLPDVGEVLA